MTKGTRKDHKYLPEAPSLRRRKSFILLVFGFFLIGFILNSCSTPKDETADNANSSTPAPAPFDQETEKILSLTNSLGNDAELASFTHSNQYHAQMSCLICHRRDDNSPRISLPGKQGHTPCIGCHTQQFADNNSTICTICHTDAETGGMKRFPPLRNFNALFDHGKHLRNAKCATCHKPTRRGVALSIPAGANAHATCFQCHSSEAKHNMSSCSVCHQPGRRPGGVSESAKAFAVNFSHAQHKRANCTACHSIKAGASRGRQVTAPLASMHFPPKNRQSCATCHNNKRAFGGDDFSDCKRCHQGNNYKF